MNAQTQITTATCTTCGDNHVPFADMATVSTCAVCADEFTACDCCGDDCHMADMGNGPSGEFYCTSCADDGDDCHSYPAQRAEAKAIGHFA